MKKLFLLLTIVLLSFCTEGWSQGKKDPREDYSFKVLATPVNVVFATNNARNLRNTVVTDTVGRVWVIDWQGNARQFRGDGASQINLNALASTTVTNDLQLLVGRDTNTQKVNLGSLKDSFWLPYPTVVSGLMETNNAAIFRGKRVREESGRTSYIDMNGNRTTVDSIYIETDTVPNIANIRNYLGSKNYIDVTDKFEKGRFKKITSYSDQVFTINCSSANLADTAQLDRVIVGSGFTDDLNGSYIFGSGINANTFVTRVLSSTVAQINQPIGITSSSITVTFTKIDSFYRIRTQTGLVYERINDGNVFLEFFSGRPDCTNNLTNEIVHSGLIGTDNTLPFFRATRLACEIKKYSGGTIRFKEGAYGFSGKLKIVTDNMSLLGVSKAATQLVFAESNAGISSEYYNNITLKRYYSFIAKEFRCVGLNRAKTAMTILGGNQSNIQNVDYFGFTDVALVLEDFSSSSINKISIAGYTTGTQTKGVSIKNTTTLVIDNLEAYKLKRGFSVATCSNIAINNSRFESIDTAIVQDNTTFNTIIGLNVQNCNFSPTSSNSFLYVAINPTGGTLISSEINFYNTVINGTFQNLLKIIGTTFGISSNIAINMFGLSGAYTIANSICNTAYQATVFRTDLRTTATVLNGARDGYYRDGILITASSPAGLYLAPQGTFAYNTSSNVLYLKTSAINSSNNWGLIPQQDYNTGDLLLPFARRYNNHSEAYGDGTLATNGTYYVKNGFFIKKTVSDTAVFYGIPKLSVNTTLAAPAASAVVDISSTTGGVLLPRMTTIQRDLIPSKEDGLEIWNITNKRKEVYCATCITPGWKAMSVND